MADLFPLLLFIFGIILALKPDWGASIDRLQKSAGTNQRRSDVELTETYYAVSRAGGILLAVVGAILFVNSL